MTKETKAKWSQLTERYLAMTNDGTRDRLPYEVQVLMHEMAMQMQDAICADSRAKAKARITRSNNNYFRTM